MSDAAPQSGAAAAPTGGAPPATDGQQPDSSSAGAAQAARPAAAASSSAADPRAEKAAKWKRVCLGLTVNVMSLYKEINRQYCFEKRQRAPGPKYNEGYDDKEGHYIVMYGEEILDRYTIQEVLGKGSFGTVVRAFDEKYQEPVAMKITRSGSYFFNQGKIEVDILVKLNNKPGLEDLVVKLRKVFVWKGHLCLVFELLSYNLYQLIKCTRFNGVSLDLTRKFAYQLLLVLRQLEQHKPPIVHCDLKPENVLLRDQNRSGIRVIDFGSACYWSAQPRHKYIQSRFYRSPEVILELPYTTAIDRWSLGCVLAELHVGTALFPGKTELEQLFNFSSLLGPLPEEMVSRSPKKDRFYTSEGGSYVLKSANPVPEDGQRLIDIIGCKIGGPRGCRKGQAGHDEQTYLHFLDFVERLLQYDPAKRLTCDEAFQHPFLAPLVLLEQQHQQMRAQTEREREAGGSAAATSTPATATTTSSHGPIQPVPKHSAPRSA